MKIPTRTQEKKNPSNRKSQIRRPLWIVLYSLHSFGPPALPSESVEEVSASSTSLAHDSSLWLRRLSLLIRKVMGLRREVVSSKGVLLKSH